LHRLLKNFAKRYLRISRVPSKHVRFAVTWGLARAVTETDPFAHGGYKLASRLLRKDRALVETLVQELCAVETMSREQLGYWFDGYADPFALDELEPSVTF
jgi:hypothetical protein